MSANEWDDHAGDWDANEDAQMYAQRALNSWEEKVAPFYPSLSECRVLDFGCGTGLLTERLAGKRGIMTGAASTLLMIATWTSVAFAYSYFARWDRKS